MQWKFDKKNAIYVFSFYYANGLSNQTLIPIPRTLLTITEHTTTIVRIDHIFIMATRATFASTYGAISCQIWRTTSLRTEARKIQ
ncbi:MAG TPA: hypothetical protein VE573_07275 [Nitrososphaeraceae archaeon]|nr:hypothetical protein [Nitrososphaeraceae archaeon]